MEPLIVLDAATVGGYSLTVLRTAALLLVSPFFSTLLPRSAIITAAVAIGFAVGGPLEAAPSGGQLLGWAVANAAIGGLLGYLSGVLLALFQFAGGILDMQGGLMAGRVIDPVTGAETTAFSRTFNAAAIAAFLAAGGHIILVSALALSFEVVDVAGGLALDTEGLGRQAIELSARMLLLGAQLALPAAAALFLIEISLGLMSRFVPQMNVFLVGLPLKNFLVIFGAATIVLAFPSATTDLLRAVEETLIDVLRSIGPSQP